MAKGNQASFAKRAREAAKRAKQAEKQLKRAARRSTDQAGEADPGVIPAEGEAAAGGAEAGAGV